MEWIQDLTLQTIDLIKSVDPIYAYLILMLASILENIFPPAPGDMITVFGASLVGLAHLSFGGVFIAVTIGSTAGFMIYYYVGKKYGHQFIEGRGKKLFPKEAIDKADKWFDKYGYNLILANRFLAGIRSVISLFSGMAELDSKRDLIYSTLSSILWNIILVSAGAFIGENWQEIVDYVQLYAKVISSLIVVAIIIIIIRKKRKK